MNERGRTRIKLSDYLAKKRDQGAIDIELDDGRVFTIDPPALWPDEVMALVRADTPDPVAAAKALLGGEERYAEFLAAGGTAAVVSDIVGEAQGAPVGESSASSSS